jgi:hypothetical protein
MSFDKIGQIAATVVIGAAVAGHLDSLNRWVQVATAKLVWESRTATWGSPIFWPTPGEKLCAVSSALPSGALNPNSKRSADRKIHSESRSNKQEVQHGTK